MGTPGDDRVLMVGGRAKHNLANKRTRAHTRVGVLHKKSTMSEADSRRCARVLCQEGHLR